VSPYRHRHLPTLLIALATLLAVAAPTPAIAAEAEGPVPPLVQLSVPLLPSLTAFTQTAGTEIEDAAKAVDRRYRRDNLRALRRSRTIDAVIRRAWLTARTDRTGYASQRATLRAARHAARVLPGLRGAEQRAALANIQRLADTGVLTTDRLPAVLLTLDRNTAWWTRRGAPTVGRSLVRGGDPITLRYIPGRGLVLHQLGSWGRVASLAGLCLRDRAHCPRRRLRSSLDRLTALAVSRDAVLRFESYFEFGGARPPWISGMTQGTAIQALTRASLILHTPEDARTARAALNAFARPAPFGVSAPGPGGGRHYAMYSTLPGLRILNGHLRALTGLRDLATLGESSLAQTLYRRGERAARVELRRADTGAWSRYQDGGSEATLGYHELATGFLADLCERDAGKRYCAAAQRFSRYMKEATRVAVTVSPRPRARDAAGLAIWVSKTSAVKVRIADAQGRTVLQRSARLARGRYRFGWSAPHSGRYSVRAVAVGPGAVPPGTAATAVRVGRSRAVVRAAQGRARAKARARAQAKARARAKRR